jgi:hypothetical protein
MSYWSIRLIQENDNRNRILLFSGETFGDVTGFSSIEKTELPKESESNPKQPIVDTNEQQSV